MLSDVRLCTNVVADRTAATKRINAARKPPPIGFFHLDVVQALPNVLLELGADLDGLVGEVGVDPRFFDGSDKVVPFTTVGRLIAVAADRTRCAHLGLLVGQRTTLASLGLLGLLLQNSSSLGDALRALETNLCVRNRGAVVELAVHNEIAVLRYIQYEPEAEGAALHSERALATVTNILRVLCGADWVLLEVLLPRSPPRDTTPYISFFRAPVRFDQEEAVLVFSAELLEHRIAGADPTVRERVQNRIRRLKAAEPFTLTDELREYLQTAVTRHRCKVERFARLRVLNRRTLCRHLRAEGTCFRRLANEAQFRVAKHLLADTTLAIGQISATLDFSEPAAFTHAFRRWSGLTPSAWRHVSQTET